MWRRKSHQPWECLSEQKEEYIEAVAAAKGVKDFRNRGRFTIQRTKIMRKSGYADRVETSQIRLDVMTIKPEVPTHEI